MQNYLPFKTCVSFQPAWDTTYQSFIQYKIILKLYISDIFLISVLKHESIKEFIFKLDTINFFKNK